MLGYNVLPTPWVGRVRPPAENARAQEQYAAAAMDIAKYHAMRCQMQRLGLSYDCKGKSPPACLDYYRWTHGSFCGFGKGSRLPQQSKGQLCSLCATVLANGR